MDKKKLKLWTDFCSKYFGNQLGVPLFDTDKNIVKTKEHGKDRRLILRRSESMEGFVVKEVSKVIDDFNSELNLYEGLIYVMYYLENDLVIPLYIGKSEKYGKQGNNLSANIKGIDKSGNKGNFCRWGDNYAYHIGDLSAIVCPNHQENKKQRKYKKWASKLFETYPDVNPKLKQNVFFAINAWQKGNVGIFPEFGDTTLTALEYQLISVAATLFPQDLLNQEGVNRGRTLWLAWLSLYSMGLSDYLLRVK